MCCVTTIYNSHPPVALSRDQLTQLAKKKKKKGRLQSVYCFLTRIVPAALLIQTNSLLAAGQ